MDAQWMAFHIFYASDSTPIVTDCVKPFVDRKRAEGVLKRWFFIRYWMEGPHIRVRLLPARPEIAEQLCRDFLDEVHAFLRRRPALYETDIDESGEVYRKFFLAEYGQDEWDRRYGRDGAMPMRANNSVHEFEYEPEYDRYGGAVGMEIGEWHFEHSSDVVATLVERSNTQVRPLLLGLSIQLSLLMAYAFLETDEAVGKFFTQYRGFWERTYDEPSDDYHGNFDKSFALSEGAIRSRIERIKHDLHAAPESLPEFERMWLLHCRELKDRVRDNLHALDFGSRGELPLDEAQRFAAVASVLLSSYIHMTNNRLGAAILDEIYISYLVEKATLGTAGAAA